MGSDCDGTDPNIHPGAIDIAGNTIDENCDGVLEVLETKPKNDDQVVLREIGFRPPYSFVVITVDALRADHLGFYGYGRETTPAIDDMASDSVVFNNAYATSGDMAASLASIFSSRYPSELSRTLADDIRYERSNDFLSEQLARSGFHTAAFPSRTYFSSRTGLSQGFALWQPYRISAGQRQHSTAGNGRYLCDRTLGSARTRPSQALFPVTTSSTRNRIIFNILMCRVSAHRGLIGMTMRYVMSTLGSLSFLPS